MHSASARYDHSEPFYLAIDNKNDESRYFGTYSLKIFLFRSVQQINRLSNVQNDS